MDNKFNNGNKKPSNDSRTRLMLIFVVGFGFASVSLLGIDIWRTDFLDNKLYREMMIDRKKLLDLQRYINISKSDPLQVFGRFFRQPEQVMRVMKVLYQEIEMNKTEPASAKCFYSCGNEQQQQQQTTKTQYRREVNEYISRNRRSNGLFSTIPAGPFVYHSCCKSRKIHIAPKKAINLNGIERDLVQTPQYPQYFVSEECGTVPGCQGCTCSKGEPFVYEAVVYIGDPKTSGNDATKMETDFIRADGCCKCLNIV